MKWAVAGTMFQNICQPLEVNVALQTGNRLATSRLQVSKCSGSNWVQNGNRLATEKLGTVWQQVGNRLATGWQQVGN